MKNEVISIVIRGQNSRIAKEMETFEFDNPIILVTVSQLAPCSIKHDGTYPAKEGWIEIKGELRHAGNPYNPSEIWIKTATLGGRRREWVRSASNPCQFC